MTRALAVAAVVLALAACGGAEEAVEPERAPTPSSEVVEQAVETETEPRPEPEPEPEPEPRPEALPGLPPELAGYETWTRLNAAPIPPRDSDPHSGTKNVYASVEAVDGVYPDGAIVVKDAMRPGADFLGLVAMMRKQAGANPEHNDWVMVEWTRESPDAEFTELASGGVCTSCHMQVRNQDYVFTRG